jgi:ankyrin repeat protein
MTAAAPSRLGASAAIAAAKAGDVAALAACHSAGGALDAYDAEGWTALLWAAARGRAAAVAALLEAGADPARAHSRSGALPIHMAGHSGDTETARLLLDCVPEQIDAVWDLNGHTILLQAVFYGHLELARLLVDHGADTAITTARGLGPIELAAQFQNAAMVEVIRPHDRPAADKAAYYDRYLAHIAPMVPDGEKPAQALADRLCKVLADGIGRAAVDPAVVDTTLDEMRALLGEGADVNRLGGPLQQPPLVIAATGNNGFPPDPYVRRLRTESARLLLSAGADPARHEVHPMGAQTIIRASVFNNLEILRLCAEHMTREALADAINEVPVVNGLTAMHDTVLRATMAAPDRLEGYLDQTRWLTENGGRHDMEDFSGRTQADIARAGPNAETRAALLDALGA